MRSNHKSFHSYVIFFPLWNFLSHLLSVVQDNCSFRNWPKAKQSMTKSSSDPLLTILIQLKISLGNLHAAILCNTFAQIWVRESAEHFHVVVRHWIRHFCCLVCPAVSSQASIILPSQSFPIWNLGFAPNLEQILSTSRHGSELSDLLVKFYNLDSNLGYLRNLLTELLILTSSSAAIIST